MIYCFRIVSDEVDDFKREIKIDAEASFIELRDAICDSCNWSTNQMSSFYLCNAGWEKQTEVTLEDMGDDESTKSRYLMKDAVLADFVDLKGQRLLFTFDYLTDRALYMELTDIDPDKNMVDAICTYSKGEAPQQEIDIIDFDLQSDAIAEMTVQAETDLDDIYEDDSMDIQDNDISYDNYENIY